MTSAKLNHKETGEEMTNPIIVGIVCAFISAMITFFVTTIAQRSMYEELSKKATRQHIEAQHNNKSVQDYIDAHIRECKAPSELERLKTGIAFLVGQMGGDPKKMGLL